ncbi:MAG: chemotaxis protein CheD [Phyllobacterium sp.]
MTKQALSRRVNIVQGEFYVSQDPGVVLSTILGSCVAACIRDPYAEAGGMNHFLLPGDDDFTSRQRAEHYGVHLMELLVNGLLQRGAQRNRLEAKLFGGARTMRGLSDIGERNADFAERFLRNEGIAIVGGSMRGGRGRRVQYWPVSGRARQFMLPDGETTPDLVPAPLVQPASSGSVEFF